MEPVTVTPSPTFNGSASLEEVPAELGAVLVDAATSRACTVMVFPEPRSVTTTDATDSGVVWATDKIVPTIEQVSPTLRGLPAREFGPAFVDIVYSLSISLIGGLCSGSTFST
jgi:hypothetical protein